MARTGVPLPFMTGLRFLFNQATVAVQPGYADVLANVSYFAPTGFLDGLAQGTAQANAVLLGGRYTDESGALIPADDQSAIPEPVRMGAVGGRPALHRTKLAAAETRLVRREDHRALATRPRTGGPRSRSPRPRRSTSTSHWVTYRESSSLTCAGGGEAIPLRAHTEQSLIAHAARNQAPALLDDAARSQFTHYVEGVSLWSAVDELAVGDLLSGCTTPRAHVYRAATCGGSARTGSLTTALNGPVAGVPIRRDTGYRRDVSVW